MGVDINQGNDNADTPLLWAIKYKKFKAVEYLLEIGADLNVIN